MSEILLILFRRACLVSAGVWEQPGISNLSRYWPCRANRRIPRNHTMPSPGAYLDPTLSGRSWPRPIDPIDPEKQHAKDVRRCWRRWRRWRSAPRSIASAGPCWICGPSIDFLQRRIGASPISSFISRFTDTSLSPLAGEICPADRAGWGYIDPRNRATLPVKVWEAPQMIKAQFPTEQRGKRKDLQG